MAAPRRDDPHFPGRPPIDAYGEGGFRFADMSHKGSLLIVASGVFAWPPTSALDVRESDFMRVFAERKQLDFLLFGTGPSLAPASEVLRLAFRARGLGLECMATGDAARTWNVLVGEGRRVAAALIAVE